MVVVDSINLRRAHFTEFWSFASASGFKVYVAELPNDVQVAYARVSSCFTNA